MTDPTVRARELFTAGIAAAEAGRLADAERHFEEALALAPGRPSLLANLGVVRVQARRFAEAVGPLQQAAQADAGQANTWLHLGLAEAGLGRHADAVASLARAIELLPDAAPLRLHRAASLVMLDQADAALADLDAAIAQAPDLAEAWSRRGSLLRDAGKLDAAAADFERALALGADPALHAYYLASVRASDSAVAAPPRAYVETLFDQYAEEFDQHLVHTLGYRGHERLVDEVMQLGPRHYRSALDLGCGTGLCGPLLRRIAGHVDGIDLSAAMLDKARATGAYDALVHADVTEYLAGTDRRDDLVVSADVFIYVGQLDDVFAGVARILAPGGAFCFTAEAASEDGGPGWQLQPSLRYAHSAGYLRQLAQRHGFDVARLTMAPLREHQQDSQDAIYACLVRR
ncbi:MAG: tetratricopeptide repeat protein [Burkholderiaceae bacterium]|nr:tetratricopeptide repeat protein [Burkholderiaceae bacterium]